MSLERRLTVRMAGLWDNLRGENAIPDIAHFNPEPINDLWPRCLRLKVIPEQGRSTTYMYQYMGKEIAQAYGQDLTGQFVNAHMHYFPGHKILKRIDELVKSPKMIVDDGQFVNDKHAIIKYRAILLPFGSEVDGVSHVIAGMSWKEF